MSILSLVGSVLGTILIFAIMAYDVLTDGRFVNWWAPEPKLGYSPARIQIDAWIEEQKSYKLTEGFACKKWDHANRDVWCPNPHCPDTEDDEVTEEIPIAKKRLYRKQPKNEAGYLWE